MGSLVYAATIHRYPVILKHGRNKEALAMESLALMAAIGLGGPRTLIVGTAEEIEEYLGATGRVLVRRYLARMRGRDLTPDPSALAPRMQEIVALRDRVAGRSTSVADLAAQILDGDPVPEDRPARPLLAGAGGRPDRPETRSAPNTGDVTSDTTFHVAAAPFTSDDGGSEGLALFIVGPRSRKNQAAQQTGEARLQAHVHQALGLKELNRWVCKYVEHALLNISVGDTPDTWPGDNLESEEELLDWLADYPLALRDIEAAWRAFGPGATVVEDLQLGLAWMSKTIFDLVYASLERLLQRA